MSHPLEPSFIKSTLLLSELHGRPARARQKLKSTIQTFEDAACSLADAVDPKTRSCWLKHAAFSKSVRLIEYFGPAEPGSIRMLGSDDEVSDLAKTSSVDFLRALHRSGLRMRALHHHLMFRALKPGSREAELRSFLLTNLCEISRDFSWLDALTPERIANQPDFLARYLPAAVEIYPGHAKGRYGIAARSLNALTLFIFDTLGVAPDPSDMIPDSVKNARRGFSAHEHMQIAGWARDLRAFFADPDAMAWIKTRYIPT